MDKINQLENRNKLLLNEIAQLNTGIQSEQEQRRIDGNFQEIEINNIEISRLRILLNNTESNE